MVVDDEYDITFTLQAGLEDGGFGVDAFTDPELALSSYKPSLYDLVLIDIKMPKMDGFVLYERLKTVEPDVKVCFLTADEMYREEIREEKHCTFSTGLFLQKPISTDDLIREINNKITQTNDFSSNKGINEEINDLLGMLLSSKRLITYVYPL